MKKIIIFSVLALMLSGCSEGKEIKQSIKESSKYHAFKAKIIDYRTTGNDQTPAITVIIDHRIYGFDCNNSDTNGSPIKVEDNNLASIKGAYLYGEINNYGWVKNTAIKAN